MRKLALILWVAAMATVGLADDYYLDLSGDDLDTRLSYLTNVVSEISEMTNDTIDAVSAMTNSSQIYTDTQVGIVTNLIASNAVALAASASLQAEAYSAGLADVGFVSVEVSSSFNNSAYTDIDLSQWVGTNSALVYLKIENLSSSGNDVWFRTNGGPILGDLDGVTASQLDSDDGAYFFVLTDSNGIIECKTDAAIEIYLTAFIRRHAFD